MGDTKVFQTLRHQRMAIGFRQLGVPFAVRFEFL
jgi:hypothetical protein